MPRFIERHREWIKNAAAEVIAVADDSGISLVDVIAELERFIIHETKVGDAGDGSDVRPGRRGYTLREGRLVEVGPSAGKPPVIVDCGRHR
jgi:hypothetical protein